MFKKVLIANRGEIALRIIRACKELGLKTVAVHSDVDKDSLHVRLANEDVCIGNADPSDSYRNIPRIISAAEVTGADAIHPGYGFLAENPRFAEICAANGIKFIGPSSSAIKSMGNKSMARQIMKSAGVPIVPGTDKAVESIDEARNIAKSIGYPVIIKAEAGGGGKGMRIVYKEDDLEKQLSIAQIEAKSAFGDPKVYIEKYIEKPRHIEIQILADSFRNVIHLGERECSIQRRHQKLIEEAPSPIVDDELRDKMGTVAVNGALSINYESAGTMEFLVDKDKNFYFMEMNTRIQVEHPVTEFTTNVDIVKEQILIAMGEKLSYKQNEIKIQGNAIECRINAEDPFKNFTPCPGKVVNFHPPGGPGVRMDTLLYTGCVISPYYDSLLAKLIAKGRNRAEAIARMKRALEETVIEGVATTIPFHIKVMDNELFKKGDIDTSFVEREFLANERMSKGF